MRRAVARSDERPAAVIPLRALVSLGLGIVALLIVIYLLGGGGDNVDAVLDTALMASSAAWTGRVAALTGLWLAISARSVPNGKPALSRAMRWAAGLICMLSLTGLSLIRV